MDNSPAAADVLGISGMHVLDGYDVQRKTGQLFRLGIRYPLHRDINIRDLREVAILQQRPPLIDSQRLIVPHDHGRNPYQQYYFLEESKTFARGGSGGFSQRGNHSVFGLDYREVDALRQGRAAL